MPKKPEKELREAICGMKSPDLEQLYAIVEEERQRRLLDRLREPGKRKMKLVPYGFEGREAHGTAQ